MSTCRKRDSTLPIVTCPGMPWMMKLEDGFEASNQLSAAYQVTKIDHSMRLNVESASRPARLTKVMVTLGEKNSHPSAIHDIISAGANILRLNMSHNDENWHIPTIRSIQEDDTFENKKQGSNLVVGIALDLRGPEIRTGIFNGDSKNRGRAVFDEGNVVTLLTEDKTRRAGDSSSFWISYPELPQICQVGDRILLDRGTVELQVSRVDKCTIRCTVTKGGTIGNEKIVNPIDTAVDLPEISEQDYVHVELGGKMECDFFIVSHVRSAETIVKIKDRIKQTGSRPICVLAKISTKQGLDCADDIIRQADGVLIDRGSMKLSVGSEKLFIVEKSIVAKCNRIGKPVMVGFGSFDGDDGAAKLDLSLLANSVLEGVDGIFLATGSLSVKDTVNLVRDAHAVCREAEQARWQRQIFEELTYKASIPLEPTHSIAIAAVQLSLKCNASGIIVVTTTGRSAMLLSIYRPRCPIVAITRYGIVARWLQLYFAVHPLHYTVRPYVDWRKDMDERVQSGMRYLRSMKYVETGEAVVIVGGWSRGSGFTNCIRVVYASPRLISNQDFEEIW